MKLTILGCYAATPRTIANPTSQLLEINNQMFLIDCGEGTQVQLRRNKIKFSKINHIFISHLHGDHCYGLVGLISTYMLLNRKLDLHIYGPKGIKDMILMQLKLSNSYSEFGLFFNELSSKSKEVIFENNKIIVKTIPLKHRIYTNGFLFQEKIGERKLNIEAINQFKIETCYYQNIKNGKNILLDNGATIENEKLSFEPNAPKSYAFCSDTIYDESIIENIKNVTILYHESTFLESESYKANKTMHSTAIQAATIANKANVNTLILGHFSTRYENTELFKIEAKTVFENTLVADDGAVFEF